MATEARTLPVAARAPSITATRGDEIPLGLWLILAMVASLGAIIAFALYLASQMPT